MVLSCYTQFKRVERGRVYVYYFICGSRIRIEEMVKICRLVRDCLGGEVNYSHSNVNFSCNMLEFSEYFKTSVISGRQPTLHAVRMRFDGSTSGILQNKTYYLFDWEVFALLLITIGIAPLMRPRTPSNSFTNRVLILRASWAFAINILFNVPNSAVHACSNRVSSLDRSRVFDRLLLGALVSPVKMSRLDMLLLISFYLHYAHAHKTDSGLSKWYARIAIRSFSLCLSLFSLVVMAMQSTSAPTNEFTE